MTEPLVKQFENKPSADEVASLLSQKRKNVLSVVSAEDTSGIAKISGNDEFEWRLGSLGGLSLSVDDIVLFFVPSSLARIMSQQTKQGFLPGIQFVYFIKSVTTVSREAYNVSLYKKTLLQAPITREEIWGHEGLRSWWESVEKAQAPYNSYHVKEGNAKTLWKMILSFNPELVEPLAKQIGLVFVSDAPIPKAQAVNTQRTSPQAKPSYATPVATHLHSDKWTLDDQLGYSLYAKAMAEFIRHKQTDPPLTIGILAPWGQGKTTLMRMIEDKIHQGKGNLNSMGVSSTLRQLMWWLDNTNSSPPEKLSFPTVWFNAWKFQNSEQVWSGLAHCIISQLVEYLPKQLDRERFWLMLQAKRLDFNAIRGDLHSTLLEKVFPMIVRWMLGFVLITSALLALAGIVWGNQLGILGGVGLPLVALIDRVWAWWKNRKELFDKPLEGKFAQYVRQPDYEGKMGYFSQIETDVRRVFDLLVKEEEPAIVFVDDLDRCSPGKVAEVIEAINLFLSGDFPNCYFVIGMDAQVVAASLEVAYEKLTIKLEHMTQSYGSLGWYFMDKFIQLPFLIPSLNEEQRKKYLAKLFRQSLEEEQASPEEVAAAEQRINAALEKKEFSASQLVTEIAKESPKIVHADPQKFREVLGRALSMSADKFSDDDPEIQNQLLRYAPYLGTTPRTVKRFANLYRFYRFSQWSRQLQGFEAASPAALGRWLVLMLRWPQLVRWIQWEGEAPSLNAAEALSKAEAFEKLVEDSTNFEDWSKAWQDKKIDKLKLERAPQLYELLRERQDEGERIVNALHLGVW